MSGASRASPVGILLPFALPLLCFGAVAIWQPTGIRSGTCAGPISYLGGGDTRIATGT